VEPVATVAKKSRKMLLVGVLVAVLIVASVGAVVVMTNPSILASGETVSLSYNYKVGQKMSYDMGLSMNALGESQTQNMTVSEEILDFNGTIYTVQTIAEAPGVSAQTNVMKMDKSGRITDFGNTPSSVQETFNSLFSMPGFGSYFPVQQAKIGESWTVPINTSILGLSTQGTVSNKITEIKSITTSAGTFNAVKSELTAHMLATTADSNGVGTLTIDVNGYGYMEKGTCTPIDYKVNITIDATQGNQTMTMTASLSMTLTDLIRGTD
jgi:hypothetical protein